MNLLTTTVIAWGERHHYPSWCWLDICTDGETTYAVFSQECKHHGQSITNGIEHAIKAYHREADLYDWPEPLDLVYVEHYRDRKGEFDAVELHQPDDVPMWAPLPEEVCWDLAYALRELEDRYTCSTN